VCSSIVSNSRRPDALHRSPTHTSCRPRWGWKGCVISTRRVVGTEAPAFCVAAQAIGARDLPSADPAGGRSTPRRGRCRGVGPDARGRGPAGRRPPGAVAPAALRAGDGRSRRSVAVEAPPPQGRAAAAGRRGPALQCPTKNS
jgi:hypothetical protein